MKMISRFRRWLAGGFSLRAWMLPVGLLTVAGWVSPCGATMNLYVGEYGAGQVTEVAPDGSTSSFASVGSPIGLTANASGTLYVAAGGSGVIEIAPDGTTSTFATGVGDAYGVTFLPDGNLAVGDFGGTIYQVTPGGDVFTVATGLDAQYSVISDSGGNIFSASFGAGTVTEIAANGTTSTFASGLGGDLTDMAFDANGNLYVSDYGGGIIDEITPGGDVSTFATGLGGPTGLAFGLSGNLYVAGYGDGTIVQITPDGSTITPVASGLNQPEGIVFAPEPSVGPLAAGLAALLWVARRKFVRQ